MENITEQDLNLSNAKIIYQNANKIQIFVTRLTTGEECVVKKQKVQSASESNDLMKECAAMMTLNHPNIVSIKSCLFTDKYEYILIVMDFYREGDLFKEIQTRLQKSNFWSKETLLNIWKDLIGGHAYMQSRGVAHRDIKPQNILKKGDQYIISDLGCAFKSKNTSSDTIAGTPSFLSPLLRSAYQRAHAGLSLQGFDHNIFKSDVFSLGLTFLFMASLQPIEEFSTSDSREFSRIKQRRIESLKYDNEIKELLSSMIEFEEEKRPDFQDLASMVKISLLTGIESITKAVANNNPGNLFGNLSSQNPSRDLEYKNPSQQINLPVQNFNKIPLSYGGNNPENQPRNYINPNILKIPGYPQIQSTPPHKNSGDRKIEVNSLHYGPVQLNLHSLDQNIEINNLHNPPSQLNMPYVDPNIRANSLYSRPAYLNPQKSNHIQNINRLKEDLQKHTENMNLNLICSGNNTNYFKWTVKIKYSIAELYLKNLILHVIQTCDPTCLYYFYSLTNFFRIKLFVLPLCYKCKICNSYIQDLESLQVECGGFIHKPCFYQVSRYSFESNFIYLLFDCGFCAAPHKGLFKELSTCTSCGKITFYKRFINQTVCLSCIQFLQCDDSSQADYNYFLESFKAIGKVSIEAYSNLNNTCGLCGSIPDILMNNYHLYCYECVFKFLNTPEAIKCHLNCCNFNKSILLNPPRPVTNPNKIQQSYNVNPELNLKNNDNLYISASLSSRKSNYNLDSKSPVTNLDHTSPKTIQSRKNPISYPINDNRNSEPKQKTNNEKQISKRPISNPKSKQKSKQDYKKLSSLNSDIPESFKNLKISRYYLLSYCLICKKKETQKKLIFKCCDEKYYCSICKGLAHPGTSCKDVLSDTENLTRCPICRINIIELKIDSCKCKKCWGLCLVSLKRTTQCDPRCKELFERSFY